MKRAKNTWRKITKHPAVITGVFKEHEKDNIPERKYKEIMPKNVQI